MKKYKLKSISEELEKFCTFAGASDFIEITEWKNGFGFNVDVVSGGIEHFNLTWGQYKLFKKLVKEIKKHGN